MAASAHVQSSSFLRGIHVCCKKITVDSFLNDILRDDMVLWKTQTVKIDASFRNKWQWDWLAMEYEGEIYFQSVLHDLLIAKSATFSATDGLCWTS